VGGGVVSAGDEIVVKRTFGASRRALVVEVCTTGAIVRVWNYRANDWSVALFNAWWPGTGGDLQRDYFIRGGAR